MEHKLLTNEHFTITKNGVSNHLDEEITEILYADLVTLRDNSQLIPGKQYRITDYVTVASFESDEWFARSAGHQFDIIVCAREVNVLSESAKAARHEGDTYFSLQRLDLWELKYCLDNDTSRFGWIDEHTLSPKGVIYYMKDEFDNECWYDFKNIQYAHYGKIFYYTFDGVSDNQHIDRSLNLSGSRLYARNSIGANFTNGYYLPFIYFQNGIFGYETSDNLIGSKCSYITFGCNCCSNIVCKDSHYIVFGDECRRNNINRTYSQVFNDGTCDLTYPLGYIKSNDGVFQIKDNAVYPTVHPDLSTQPSILPQRYGNLPIKEVLIAAGRDSEIPSNAMVIEAFSFSEEICSPATCKKSNDIWSISNSMGFIPLFTLVKYVEDSGNYYYGSGGIKIKYSGTLPCSVPSLQGEAIEITPGYDITRVRIDLNDGTYAIYSDLSPEGLGGCFVYPNFAYSPIITNLYNGENFIYFSNITEDGMHMGSLDVVGFSYV